MAFDLISFESTSRRVNVLQTIYHVSSMLLPILLCRPESKSVWPDLAKFFNFGKIKNVIGNSWRVYLVFSKILYLRWPIFDAIGRSLFVVNGQILKIV